MKYLLLILIITLASCNFNLPDERKELKEGDMDYTIMVIDSCEYIWYKFGGVSGQTMAHKGNCKNHQP